MKTNRNDYSRWVDLTEKDVKEWFDIINTETSERMQALYIIKTFCPKSLIEIGAGGGKDYGMFKEHLQDCAYTGIDVSARVIDELKSRYPEINMVNANFYDGLSFKDNSFDIVYSRHTLEHFISYEKPIEEMIRIARKAVVVVMFRALLNPGDSKLAQVYHGGRNDNRYLRPRFVGFLNNLDLDYDLVPQFSSIKKDVVVIKVK